MRRVVRVEAPPAPSPRCHAWREARAGEVRWQRPPRVAGVDEVCAICGAWCRRADGEIVVFDALPTKNGRPRLGATP